MPNKFGNTFAMEPGIAVSFFSSVQAVMPGLASGDMISMDATSVMS
jgi:hypothetical protein